MIFVLIENMPATLGVDPRHILFKFFIAHTLSLVRFGGRYRTRTYTSNIYSLGRFSKPLRYPLRQSSELVEICIKNSALDPASSSYLAPPSTSYRLSDGRCLTFPPFRQPFGRGRKTRTSEITESKSVALPLGNTPINLRHPHRYKHFIKD